LLRLEYLFFLVVKIPVKISVLLILLSVRLLRYLKLTLTLFRFSVATNEPTNPILYGTSDLVDLWFSYFG